MDKDNFQITSKKTGRKKDNIRSFFVVKNDLLSCNIDNCKSTFSINSSTSTLRYHIYQNHVKIVDNNINDNIIPMNNKNKKHETKIIELIDKKLNVIAITTDNEPLMIAVCKKIIEKFPVIIHVPCAAHIIQLCLKKFFEINKIKIIGDKINNIIYSINE